MLFLGIIIISFFTKCDPIVLKKVAAWMLTSRLIGVYGLTFDQVASPPSIGQSTEFHTGKPEMYIDKQGKVIKIASESKRDGKFLRCMADCRADCTKPGSRYVSYADCPQDCLDQCCYTYQQCTIKP